eukprot:7953114-Pyramimonas_sp.AAC.2
MNVPQVAKALYIDYPATPEEVEKTAHHRPLDYYLFPMHHVLKLKTSIYDPPEAPELQTSSRPPRFTLRCLMPRAPPPLVVGAAAS